MPTPEWRRKHYPQSQGFTEVDRTWKPGYSIQLAIGQGQVLVTPLQMARFYAMIANGGKLVTPHIADDVELTGNDGQPVRVLRKLRRAVAAADGRRPDRAHVRPARARRGDARAVRHVVGRLRQLPGRRSPARRAAPRSSSRCPAIRTRSNLTQSWWCGYGPYDAPSIVVCAVIENGGHGGTAAAPAALKVFEQYFHTTAHDHDPR